MNNHEEIYATIPTLETERLLLRRLTLSDQEDLFEYASDPLVSRFMPWDVHRSLADSEAFISYITKAYEQKRKLAWAIELKQENKMIGTIDYVNWLPKQFKAEITYVLSRKYWGQGYTGEAAKELLRFGFENMELNRVEAPILTENNQSKRVLEKLGMKLEEVAREAFFM